MWKLKAVRSKRVSHHLTGFIPDLNLLEDTTGLKSQFYDDVPQSLDPRKGRHDISKNKIKLYVCDSGNLCLSINSGIIVFMSTTMLFFFEQRETSQFTEGLVNKMSSYPRGRCSTYEEYVRHFQSQILTPFGHVVGLHECRESEGGSQAMGYVSLKGHPVLN